MSGTTLPVKAHAELSPSGAARWMNCPGSIAAERGLPDKDSVHSREGTAAHALGELAFQRGKATEFWVGETIEGVVVTEDMALHTQTYVDALDDYADGAEIVRVERRLTMPPSMRPPGEMGGTCDAWFYYPGIHLLRVVDLKFGKGVVVEAEYPGGKPNPQLGYYAALAWLDLHAESAQKAESVREIELVVVQPRAFHPEGAIRTFRMVLPELKAFTKELILKARTAMTPNVSRVPGDWCGFCKAKLTCGPFRDRALEAAQVTFTDLLEDAPLALASPTGMVPAELGRVFAKAKVLKEWITMVERTVLGELESGRPVPGWALKPKRANRKWADEKDVLAFAKKAKVKKADLMEAPKLKSPAQLEAALKKLGLPLPEDLVVRESSGYTLTTDDDPKAVVAQGIDALEDAPAETSETGEIK